MECVVGGDDLQDEERHGHVITLRADEQQCGVVLPGVWGDTRLQQWAVLHSHERL